MKALGKYSVGEADERKNLLWGGDSCITSLNHSIKRLLHSMVTSLTHYLECWVFAGKNHSILKRHGLV